jgi:hypothetical protein
MGGMVENIVRWFTGIGAAFKKRSKYFSRPMRPPLDFAAETCAESSAEEARPVATETESAVATPTTTSAFTAPVAAIAKVGQDAQISRVAPIPPDQHEIERRRELVRTLFNDFWSGRDDKPAAFVDRLNQAEPFLNERLSACGEFWQLDAKTREMLNLPPRPNSREEARG